jgi:integrase
LKSPTVTPGRGVVSRRRVHAALHRALNDAIEAGYLDHNPAWRAARNLKVELHELDVWTADELRQFLAATLGTPLYPLWHVVALTSLRRGEACGLRWDDVDTEASTLTVRRSRVPVNGIVYEETPRRHARRGSLTSIPTRSTSQQGCASGSERLVR